MNSSSLSIAFPQIDAIEPGEPASLQTRSPSLAPALAPALAGLQAPQQSQAPRQDPALPGSLLDSRVDFSQTLPGPAQQNPQSPPTQPKMVEQTGHQPVQLTPAEIAQPVQPPMPAPDLKTASPPRQQPVKAQTGGVEDLFDFVFPAQPTASGASLLAAPPANPKPDEQKALSESFFDALEFSKDLDMSSVIPSNQPLPSHRSPPKPPGEDASNMFF